jgi:hypothetical protein
LPSFIAFSTSLESEETPEQPSQEEMPQEQPTDNAMPDEGGIDMGESVVKENKSKIDEIFNQVMQDKEEDGQMQKPITNISYKKKPFTSPNFK